MAQAGKAAVTDDVDRVNNTRASSGTFRISADTTAGGGRATLALSWQRRPTTSSLTLISLSRDGHSTNRGSATSIVFDRYDDQDNQTSPDRAFMYAPYRSERPNGSNWHIARIIANGSTVTLSVGVTGSIGNVAFAQALKVYCDGFYPAWGATAPIGGTKSNDWEMANAFARIVDEPFVGTVPLRYKLDASGVNIGTYVGRMIFTLTSR